MATDFPVFFFSSFLVFRSCVQVTVPVEMPTWALIQELHMVLYYLFISKLLQIAHYSS